MSENNQGTATTTTTAPTSVDTANNNQYSAYTSNYNFGYNYNNAQYDPAAYAQYCNAYNSYYGYNQQYQYDPATGQYNYNYQTSQATPQQAATTSSTPTTVPPAGPVPPPLPTSVAGVSQPSIQPPAPPQPPLPAQPPAPSSQSSAMPPLPPLPPPSTTGASQNTYTQNPTVYSNTQSVQPPMFPTNQNYNMAYSTSSATAATTNMAATTQTALGVNNMPLQFSTTQPSNNTNTASTTMSGVTSSQTTDTNYNQSNSSYQYPTNPVTDPYNQYNQQYQAYNQYGQQSYNQGNWQYNTQTGTEYNASTGGTQYNTNTATDTNQYNQQSYMPYNQTGQAPYNQTTQNNQTGQTPFNQTTQNNQTGQTPFNQTGQAQNNQTGQTPYNQQGYNQTGQTPYNQTGQTQNNQTGQTSYNKQGYNQTGQTPYNQQGYSQTGQENYNQTGQTQYNQQGYNQTGQTPYNQGYNQQAYSQTPQQPQNNQNWPQNNYNQGNNTNNKFNQQRGARGGQKKKKRGKDGDNFIDEKQNQPLDTTTRSVDKPQEKLVLNKEIGPADSSQPRGIFAALHGAVEMEPDEYDQSTESESEDESAAKKPPVGSLAAILQRNKIDNKASQETSQKKTSSNFKPKQTTPVNVPKNIEVDPEAFGLPMSFTGRQPRNDEIDEEDRVPETENRQPFRPRQSVYQYPKKKYPGHPGQINQNKQSNLDFPSQPDGSKPYQRNTNFNEFPNPTGYGPPKSKWENDPNQFGTRPNPPQGQPMSLMDLDVKDNFNKAPFRDNTSFGRGPGQQRTQLDDYNQEDEYNFAKPPPARPPFSDRSFGDEKSFGQRSNDPNEPYGMRNENFGRWNENMNKSSFDQGPRGQDKQFQNKKSEWDDLGGSRRPPQIPFGRGPSDRNSSFGSRDFSMEQEPLEKRDNFNQNVDEADSFRSQDPYYDMLAEDPENQYGAHDNRQTDRFGGSGNDGQNRDYSSEFNKRSNQFSKKPEFGSGRQNKQPFEESPLGYPGENNQYRGNTRFGANPDKFDESQNYPEDDFNVWPEPSSSRNTQFDRPPPGFPKPNRFPGDNDQFRDNNFSGKPNRFDTTPGFTDSQFSRMKKTSRFDDDRQPNSSAVNDPNDPNYIPPHLLGNTDSDKIPPRGPDSKFPTSFAGKTTSDYNKPPINSGKNNIPGLLSLEDMGLPTSFAGKITAESTSFEDMGLPTSFAGKITSKKDFEPDWQDEDFRFDQKNQQFTKQDRLNRNEKKDFGNFDNRWGQDKSFENEQQFGNKRKSWGEQDSSFNVDKNKDDFRFRRDTDNPNEGKFARQDKKDNFQRGILPPPPLPSMMPKSLMDSDFRQTSSGDRFSTFESSQPWNKQKQDNKFSEPWNRPKQDTASNEPSMLPWNRQKQDTASNEPSMLPWNRRKRENMSQDTPLLPWNRDKFDKSAPSNPGFSDRNEDFGFDPKGPKRSRFDANPNEPFDPYVTERPVSPKSMLENQFTYANRHQQPPKPSLSSVLTSKMGNFLSQNQPSSDFNKNRPNPANKTSGAPISQPGNKQPLLNRNNPPPSATGNKFSASNKTSGALISQSGNKQPLLNKNNPPPSATGNKSAATFNKTESNQTKSSSTMAFLQQIMSKKNENGGQSPVTSKVEEAESLKAPTRQPSTQPTAPSVAKNSPQSGGNKSNSNVSINQSAAAKPPVSKPTVPFGKSSPAPLMSIPFNQSGKAQTSPNKSSPIGKTTSNAPNQASSVPKPQLSKPTPAPLLSKPLNQPGMSPNKSNLTGNGKTAGSSSSSASVSPASAAPKPLLATPAPTTKASSQGAKNTPINFNLNVSAPKPMFSKPADHFNKPAPSVSTEPKPSSNVSTTTASRNVKPADQFSKSSTPLLKPNTAKPNTPEAELEFLFNQVTSPSIKALIAKDECKLCNVKNTSVPMAIQHYKGKNHAKKVKICLDSMPASQAQEKAPVQSPAKAPVTSVAKTTVQTPAKTSVVSNLAKTSVVSNLAKTTMQTLVKPTAPTVKTATTTTVQAKSPTISTPVKITAVQGKPTGPATPAGPAKPIGTPTATGIVKPTGTATTTGTPTATGAAKPTSPAKPAGTPTATGAAKPTGPAKPAGSPTATGVVKPTGIATPTKAPVSTANQNVDNTYCKLCDIKLKNLTQASAHYSTPAHHQKVKSMNPQSSPGPSATSQELSNVSKTPEVKPAGKTESKVAPETKKPLAGNIADKNDPKVTPKKTDIPLKTEVKTPVQDSPKPAIAERGRGGINRGRGGMERGRGGMERGRGGIEMGRGGMDRGRGGIERGRGGIERGRGGIERGRGGMERGRGAMERGRGFNMGRGGMERGRGIIRGRGGFGPERGMDRDFMEIDRFQPRGRPEFDDFPPHRQPPMPLLREPDFGHRGFGRRPGPPLDRGFDEFGGPPPRQRPRFSQI